MKSGELWHRNVLIFCLLVTYFQGLDLLLKALGDSSDAVVNSTQQVFLPAFAAWAQDLERLDTNLVSTVLKRLEVTAIVSTSSSTTFMFFVM